MEIGTGMERNGILNVMAKWVGVVNLMKTRELKEGARIGSKLRSEPEEELPGTAKNQGKNT